MPIGPVFRHEMLSAGRKRRNFWAVVLVGLAMLGLLTLGYTVVSEANRIARYTTGGDSSQLSIAGVARLTSTFYVMFAWATMIGVLLITPVVTAGAIATERERRTIEYLFATDLSNSEIVFDKLLARLLVVAKMVLATLPVLAIFRLLGGVPGKLLLYHFAMLASTATLTAAIALTVGVWCQRARDAASRAIAAVFLWMISLPLLFALQAYLDWLGYGWAAWIGDHLLLPAISFLAQVHPVVALTRSVGVGGTVLGVDMDPTAIGKMIGYQLLVAAGFLLLSVVMVRRVHLNAASTPGQRKEQASGAPSTRSPYERRPMLWKEMFAASVAKKETFRAVWARRLGVGLLLLAVFGTLLTMLWQAYLGAFEVDFTGFMGVASAMTVTCGSILVLMMGARAAGLVTNERERDTWLSLLTTPLTAADIVNAKVLGNFYAFRWAIGGVVLIPLLGVLLDPIALFPALATLATVACSGWAASAIGIAFSLRMKSSIKAVGGAVLLLLGIGALYTPLAIAFVSLSGAPAESVMLLVLPPSVPFLYMIPINAIAFGLGPEREWLLAAYFAGLLFYGFLGFAVTMSSVSTLDRVCGRGSTENDWSASPG
ncbi:ABC-2 family transporter protein [Planctomycetes bacterium MalM25]|nr:ABC-2 family transporter protein [Planctomycetes bacterium MalM25]